MAFINVLSPFQQQGYNIDIEAELAGQRMNERSFATEARSDLGITSGLIGEVMNGGMFSLLLTS